MVACLSAYRAAIERFLLAPFGSVVLFDAQELQLLALNVLRQRSREQVVTEPAEGETP